LGIQTKTSYAPRWHNQKLLVIQDGGIKQRESQPEPKREEGKLALLWL
jgi:hypothetical protein